MTAKNCSNKFQITRFQNWKLREPTLKINISKNKFTGEWTDKKNISNHLGGDKESKNDTWSSQRKHQDIVVKLSMGSDSSSTEAAWKQSTASAILPSSLWTIPKWYQAKWLVGSILSASDIRVRATGNILGPILHSTDPINILQGTYFGSNKREFV